MEKLIDPRDFRRYFYKRMYEYLYDCNLKLIADDKPIPIYQMSRRKGIRYLGIDSDTLRPCIGIMESMDGCDVYDLELICNAFSKDESGWYIISNQSYPYKFILEDKSVLDDLVSKYYKGKNLDNPKLKLIRNSEDFILDKHTNLFSVKIPDYVIFHFTTVAGKYYYQNLCNMPEELSEKISTLYKFERGLDKKLMYYSDRLEVARKYKREKKYDKAIQIYKKVEDLDLGFDVYHDLLVCFRKLKDSENEKMVAKIAYDKFPNKHEYKTAYLKVIGGIKKNNLSEESYEVSVNIVYGDEYETRIRQLKEYTFSEEDNPFYDFFYTELSEKKWKTEEKKYQEYLRKIRQIQYHFSESIKEGKQLEQLGEIDCAVKIYETLIAEKCFVESPYERLAIIYSKAKRKTDLIRVLESGIRHFENLENKQFEYVIGLAQKYSATDKLREILLEKGVVKYWIGNIVLYKKYPIVDKFKVRLAKLKKQQQS